MFCSVKTCAHRWFDDYTPMFATITAQADITAKMFTISMRFILVLLIVNKALRFLSFLVPESFYDNNFSLTIVHYC